MIGHDALQDACRAQLLTLLVCTTGAITLAATATGYTRTTGDFVADGFAPGMELTPAGFASNVLDTIATVSALAITTVHGRTVEVSALGRSLSVGLPSRRAWENETLTPEPRHPYVEEQYLPGPSSLNSAGRNGILTLEPMYSPRIFVPRGAGKAAPARYADAITSLFAPNTRIALPTGTASDALRVRGDVGPYRTQLAINAKGTHATNAVTAPLRCFTTNTI